MDIGSVTEHLLRFAPCNLLLASRRFSPPLDIWSESAVRWTEEAEAALKPSPKEYQGAIRMMAQRLALEQGHTVITRSLVMEAMKALRPRQEDMRRMGRAALTIAVETLRTRHETIYLCRRCGHSVRGQQPVACPVCKAKGESFLEVDPEALEVVARSQGGVEVEEAFDGRALRWARAALARLERISDPNQRSRAKSRVEKEARYRKLPVITLEFVLRQLTE
jgi:hypothetical protein